MCLCVPGSTSGTWDDPLPGCPHRRSPGSISAGRIAQCILSRSGRICPCCQGADLQRGPWLDAGGLPPLPAHAGRWDSTRPGGRPSKTAPHWRQVRGSMTTAIRSPKQFFQLCQVLGVGADPAALPAGDHRLIYSPWRPQAAPASVFWLCGLRQCQIQHRPADASLCLHNSRAARSLVFPMAGPFRSHRPSPAQCY